MTRRGILLAGGAGDRLRPLTNFTSKQLLPVYDKPMIYYPLSLLMLAGIRDVLIVTTPRDNENFQQLLGDGSQWGLNIGYAIQEKPEGIAQAFVIGAAFVGSQPSCLVLGDNILCGHGLTQVLRTAATADAGATVFGYHVHDPHRYGVVSFDAAGRAISITEKPARPESNWAVIGLYFYDSSAVDRARSLQPSGRGEYEITDLNQTYLADGRLQVEPLGRGYAWFDAGTHKSLLEAGEFVSVLQSRQNQLIGSPEEIAFNAGWISIDELAARARELGKSEYGRTLQLIVDANAS